VILLCVHSKLSKFKFAQGLDVHIVYRSVTSNLYLSTSLAKEADNETLALSIPVCTLTDAYDYHGNQSHGIGLPVQPVTLQFPYFSHTVYLCVS
jgi:hypothetical protein